MMIDSDNPRDIFDHRLQPAAVGDPAPTGGSFTQFLQEHARVADRHGSAMAYSLAGRAPLALVADWIDKILRNTLEGESVEIDGVIFPPGALKGATVAVGGGAQFGKTILELNLMAYATAVRFISVGNYLPDRPKVEEIVGQKFRPQVLDLYPWMARMIQLGKVQNASGKTINRKESYTVTDGRRKAFGNFCGMHKPPTSISIDIALLDEVDDIPDRHVGYVDGRMTNSPVRLTCFIGTQRLAGAGQNARLAASSYHVKLYACPGCGEEWNLEENFPRVVRVARGSEPQPDDPRLTAEAGYRRDAHYYCACPACGTQLDREAGRFVAKHPERVQCACLGVRVSQFTISAIDLGEIVSAWFAALADPSGEALRAFHCDRLGLPHAGAAQPITQAVLDHCRFLGTGTADAPQAYAMSLAGGSAPRFAGLDTGPRCWFWCDEVVDASASHLVWAELIASGKVMTRVPELVHALGISCLLMDAGGEPELTKRLVLALNGLDHMAPPARSRAELLRARLTNLGTGLSWDGEQGRWSGLRAAAVLFVAGEARGREQTIGFTEDGKLYPLIKCHRRESIQTAVNDFLTPADGVLEMIGPAGQQQLRTEPRARLPMNCTGPGISQSVLDTHLLNLRKERNFKSGAEEWIDGVENHLGLAKVYAGLAATIGQRPALKVAYARPTGLTRTLGGVNLGLGASIKPTAL